LSVWRRSPWYRCGFCDPTNRTSDECYGDIFSIARESGALVRLPGVGSVRRHYARRKTALSDSKTLFTSASSFLPQDPTLFNLQRVLVLVNSSDPRLAQLSYGKIDFFRALTNSVIFTILAVAPQIAFQSRLVPWPPWPTSDNTSPVWLWCLIFAVRGPPSTTKIKRYAFARLRFAGSQLIFSLFLGATMIPAVVLFIPNFILIRDLGWLNTFQGMGRPMARRLRAPF
jgi:multiple sugar transport system permease protein